MRSEVIKVAIDENLLQTPEFKHEKAQNERDIIFEYVRLYSFYLDLKSKIETIKKLNECFKTGYDECLEKIKQGEGQ